MHEGEDFQQNPLDKAYFVVKMTGPAMVRLTSSDFGKPPKNPQEFPSGCLPYKWWHCQVFSN